MRSRAMNYLVAAVLLSLIPAASFALVPYTQTFEGLDQGSETALSDDGWLVFGNVFAPDGTYLYGYGSFPAPNTGAAFCQIALEEGGDEQGDQVLSVFSDYENLDHAAGNLIESNVFQEQEIVASDIGTAWKFKFQHKLGNIEGGSTAQAFIKILDPDNGYALTNFFSVNTTSIPDTWGSDSLVFILDDPALEYQLFQIGFSNVATNYEGSGIFYDNVVLEQVGSLTGVPEITELGFASLSQNAPNPFTLNTRIDFALEQPSRVDLSIFDIDGRRVATHLRGEQGAGGHQRDWDGRAEDGSPSPSGTYWYVLNSEAGSVSGRMTLAR